MSGETRRATSHDLLCVICDAAIVLLLMLRRGEGEGQGEWGGVGWGGDRGLTKLKSYSVGHAAAALLSLHLFLLDEKNTDFNK